MSALTAALAATVLATPTVDVTHDRIIEAPRKAEITIQPAASDIGIDDTALTDFIVRASQRYYGQK